MKTKNIERSGNLQSVQLLRGLAALMVMLHLSVGGDYLSKSNIVRIVAAEPAPEIVAVTIAE